MSGADVTVVGSLSKYLTHLLGFPITLSLKDKENKVKQERSGEPR